MSCNRCKQAERYTGDSWCLSCAAWEQIGTELSSHWGTAGSRALASDLVVSCVRQLRACRRLGVAAAVPGRAAVSLAPAAGRTSARDAAAGSGSVPSQSSQGLQTLPKALGEVKEEAEEDSSEESGSGSEDEEEVAKSNKERSPISRKRSEPRPASRGDKDDKSEDRRKDKRSAGGEEKAEKKRHRGSGEGERKTKKRKPGERGGRKHQRLHRAERDPYKILHHKVFGTRPRTSGGSTLTSPSCRNNGAFRANRDRWGASPGDYLRKRVQQGRWPRMGRAPSHTRAGDGSRSAPIKLPDLRKWVSGYAGEDSRSGQGWVLAGQRFVEFEKVAEETYREEQVLVHLCLQEPCAETELREEVIHTSQVKFWMAEAYASDYVRAKGRKIIQDYLKSIKKGPPKTKATPKETASKPPRGGRTPKTKPPKKDEQKAPSGRKQKEAIDESGGDEEAKRLRLRERLAEVKEGWKEHGGRRDGGRPPRESSSAVAKTPLTAGISMPMKMTGRGAYSGQLALRDTDTPFLSETNLKKLSAGEALLAQAAQAAKSRADRKKKDGRKKRGGKEIVKLFSSLLGLSKKKEKKKKGKKEKKRKRGRGGYDPEGNGQDPDPDDDEEEESEEEDLEGSAEESSDPEDSSKESEDSLEAPLRKKALKSPGKVMEMLIKQAAMHLDQAAVLEGNEAPSVVGGVRIGSYFSLMIKPYHPNSHPMVRELYSLAQVIDSLRAGNLPQAADGLAGRFIAVHQALEDGHWGAASGLEVYPLESASSASATVLLQAQRHRKLVAKAQGTYYQPKGKGYNYGGKGNQQNWYQDRYPKGKGDQGKGKEKGRGQRQKQWNQWSNWKKSEGGGNNQWKDNKDEKPKEKEK